MIAPKRCILFVDQFGTVGGGQRVLLGMVRRGVQRGWMVAAAVPQGPLVGMLEECGASVSVLDIPMLADGSKGWVDGVALGLALPHLVRQFRAAVRKYKPDLVHVNGGRALLPVMLSHARMPVTFHAHTMMFGSAGTLAKGLLRSHRVKRVVVPSRVVAAFAKNSLKVPQSQIVTIPNWVDPSFAHGTVATHRDEGAHAGQLIVLVIGRVTATKGQLDALQSVLKVRAAGIDAVLWVAGVEDGPYVAELLELSRFDPAALVRLGARDDVPELLAGAHVVVVASTWAETFGLAAVEAMAAGVPVIAYDSGALSEVIGDAGMLVPAGDRTALTAAMALLAANPQERHRLAALGRQRVSERFSYEVQTDALYAVFEDVVRSAP